MYKLFEKEISNMGHEDLSAADVSGPLSQLPDEKIDQIAEAIIESGLVGNGYEFVIGIALGRGEVTPDQVQAALDRAEQNNP